MKMFKKVNPLIFLMLCSLTLLVSCKKTNTEDLNQAEEMELIKKQLDEQKAKSLVAVNNIDNPQFRDIPADGNEVCYSAHLTIDTDCGGEATPVGWNTETYSWSCCWDEVYDMYYYAYQQGWCYDFPADQCNSYYCAGGPVCAQDNGGGN